MTPAQIHIAKRRKQMMNQFYTGLIAWLAFIGALIAFPFI